MWANGIIWIELNQLDGTPGLVNKAKLPCPRELQARTWSYHYDAGSGNQCAGASQMEVCDTDVTVNLTKCHVKLFYSGNNYSL